jgi:WD40 repeat protein
LLINRHLFCIFKTLMIFISVWPATTMAFSFPDVVEIATLKEKNEVGGLEFSADGTQLIALAGAYSRDAHVWNWRQKFIISTLSNAYAEPMAATPSRASPDGNTWVRCGTSVTVWNARTWQLLNALPAEPGFCSAVEFSPDGSFLVVLRYARISSGQPSIVIYDTKSWQELWSIATGPFYVKSLSFSYSGRIFAIGGHVTNPKSWNYAGSPPTFGTPPFPDTGLIAIVDIEKHAVVQTIAVPQSTYASSQTVSWNKYDISIVYGADAGLRSFDAISGVPHEVILSEDKNSRTAVHPSPDGRYRIESGFGQRGELIRVTDVSEGERKVLREISGRARAVAWSRDSRHFALGGSAVSIMNLTPLSSLLFPSDGKIIIYELR